MTKKDKEHIELGDDFSPKFNADGTMPAIAVDYISCEVLMLAYMNKEALEKTLQSKKAHYYSRSRQKLWLKGEQSGHVQIVKEISVDCDQDTILLKVHTQKTGANCHNGYKSCFYRSVDMEKPESKSLTNINNYKLHYNDKKRLFNPKETYK